MMTSHALSFDIHNWSSYSAAYHPRNVLVDKPKDPSSRWSSESNHSPQFITMKLRQPAVVNSITFGKYEKGHVCNMKKFLVYGGINENHMIELLSSGLNNDEKKETFSLRHTIQGKIFPCQYIKVVPTLSHGTNFNFSIWYVQLIGIDNPEVVRPRLKWFNNYREQEAIRLCLKHFRQKNYAEAFEALQKKSKVVLEDPLLTHLHTELVKNGNFEESENLIEKSARDGLLNQFISNQTYKSKWSPIHPLDGNGIQCSIQPGPRGGHQMCIDIEKQTLFLLGGWDGTKELADFWMYEIASGQWHCISDDMTSDGGPTARSCHKVCIDTKRRDMYLLGRFLDGTARGQIEVKSDFYRYDLDTGVWEVLSTDTHSDGGPHLIFDHQMLYDEISDKIFVFGGRILTNTHDDQTLEPLFSGLFSYHIQSKTWTKIREDPALSGMTPRSQQSTRARSGHSMLIDSNRRLLYVFAGQRGNKEYLSDFFSYHLDSGEVKAIHATSSDSTFPSPGFTQRATFDSQTNELFMLSGLSKEDKKEEIRNSFWICDMSTYKWSCVYRNENTGNQYWDKMHDVEPRPRFAHQLVYDHVNKVHYLFGGNPGRSTLKTRLDDFWSLRLHRIKLEDVVRNCRYFIRKLRYQELVKLDAISGLRYLQDQVSQVIDHSDKNEREEFESLASTLFHEKSPNTSSDEDEHSLTDATNDDQEILWRTYKSRTQVFDKLGDFFPQEMVQPTGDIVDFVNF
ncbi:muskelin-like [Clytia hemisphaerica]|uniref:Muskelin N-terminal domain-containing protein n=1 Tax=Clytia hemisphaerica TaxID=252671 RepID=A0A7M5XAA0_9CNID